MPISKAMFKDLPQEEQQRFQTPLALAKELHSAQSGNCALCDTALNLNSDYQADHIVPTERNGKTERSNLQLAHTRCNKAKRHYEQDVRPYLRLREFMNSQGGLLKYDGVQEHFEIEPREVVVLDSGNELKLHLPDEREVSSPIFSETVNGREMRYAFVELGQNAIFNDGDVQPRNIKVLHAFNIFRDLHQNPLHEPPSCRLDVEDENPRILMFDGQHKTIANWMLGRETVVAKVYLDLERDAAVQLVNSIQSRIKKLPLSAFESVAKMGDEYLSKFYDYQEASEPPHSEAGFLAFFPAERKTAAKQSFAASLISNVLEDDQLTIKQHVKQPNVQNSGHLTEQMVRTKILGPLLHSNPLDEAFEKSEGVRQTESQIAVRLINKVVTLVFDKKEENEACAMRSQRISYQASLHWLFTNIRLIYTHFCPDQPEYPMARQPKPGEWKKIEKCIEEAVNFPVWTEHEETPGMRPILTAMSKNQNLDREFSSRGFHYGSLVRPETLKWDDFLRD